MRRTKIVTTLGPVTDDPAILERLILAGADVVRLNFSHGDAADHQRRANLVREMAERHQRHIAILADLQGPKIRIARFKEGKVKLQPGAAFTLDAELDSQAGDASRVGIDYKALPDDCRPGDVLLLDDGRLQLRVTAIEGRQVHTEVLIGGVLSNNKGINRQGGGLSAAALTDKDRADILSAASIGVDYVAVSFPRCAEDMQEARRLLAEAESQAGLVAKIERAEAVADRAELDAIIRASDAVMVARGDLGVEIGDAELIGEQKYLIQRARALNRVVITATQMMESMIQNPMPTRAEVFDVANAVLDGTDAVMLSAETAAGQHPVEVVEAMARVCLGAEKYLLSQPALAQMETPCERTDQAIARATMFTANQLKGVKAIICFTESGSTPLWMSRIRSGLPIFAFTRHPATLNRVALFRGVQAVRFDVTQVAREALNAQAIRVLQERGVVQSGDLVIVTQGEQLGVDGGTNAMKVVQV